MTIGFEPTFLPAYFIQENLAWLVFDAWLNETEQLFLMVILNKHWSMRWSGQALERKQDKKPLHFIQLQTDIINIKLFCYSLEHSL